MKRADRLRRNAELTMKKIRSIAQHIRNVEDNCLQLGSKLIERGDIDLGHKLIANGYAHDLSKFFGIEWENMAPGQTSNEESAKLKLKMAIQHHRSINLHHPEAWPGGIKDMPDVYLAEFCSDIKARSEEFGTSLRDWINDEAIKRWDFTKDDEVYKKIMEYVNLLCEKPFDDLVK